MTTNVQQLKEKLCVYLPSSDIQEKSYARTISSPNLLLSSLLLKSWIFLALITSASSLFQASMFLYGKLYFFCLTYSPFQFLLVSSRICCPTQKDFLSIFTRAKSFSSFAINIIFSLSLFLHEGFIALFSHFQCMAFFFCIKWHFRCLAPFIYLIYIIL